MNELLFYITILLTNIIQGITGFAGTILAMPFSIRLVGIDTAVPILNLLGLLSGIYVFAGNIKEVNWRLLTRTVGIMGISCLGGILIKNHLSGNPQLLYYILGSIVLGVAIHGLLRQIIYVKKSSSETLPDKTAEKSTDKQSSVNLSDTPLMTLLLIAAGIVHGMFVCGGPLLIIYMTEKLKNKAAFRATISTVWIFLNGLIFLTQLFSGSWTLPVIKSGLISIPFLLGGMFIGGVLYKKMSQKFFVILTYILLIIAGASLFFK